MPIYFRKSVSLGLLRVNFSKSGVGLSAGVRGFRIGTGPRGHYVRAGLGGIYYQQAFGRQGQHPQHAGRRQSVVPASPLAFVRSANNSQRIETRDADLNVIDSADVSSLRSERFEPILHEIESRRRRWPMAILFALLPAAATIGLLVAHQSPALAVAAAAVMLLALLIGRWMDSTRRVTVLAYDLDPEVERGYEMLCLAFDELAGCAAAWHVSHSGAVRDLNASKRNAGATSIVQMARATLRYGLPRGVRSNLQPPMFRAGRQNLYFLPDLLLIDENGALGAIGYESLTIQTEQHRFIESGAVPTDAQVVGETWAYVNKSGGPDRRFSNNRRIPVCLYDRMAVGGHGLNEEFKFSRAGCAEEFARLVGRFSDLARSQG